MLASFDGSNYTQVFVPYHNNNNREMLTSALGHWLIIYIKKVFMGNEKKVINILTVFFISHKSGIKTFLKWIIKECPKGTR